MGAVGAEVCEEGIWGGGSRTLVGHLAGTNRPSK